MNTLTKNTAKAKAKAKDIANIRGQPVWLHFATTLTFWIDYVPDWWSQKDFDTRKMNGEIVLPDVNHELIRQYPSDHPMKGDLGTIPL